MPHHSKDIKPFLTYLEHDNYINLKRFAKTAKKPMAQIVREAVSARITTGNPYVSGFNDGIHKSIDAINNMNHAQMRFPSGKSFAEIVSDDLTNLLMKEQHEADGSP
jgi:hypothetical protein